MKTLNLAILFGLIFNLSFAQKANFKLAEKFTSTNMNKMVGSTSVRPVWLKDSDKFWYSYKTGEGNNYYLVDPAQRSKNPLFDNEHMAAELTKITNKPYNIKDLPLKKLKFKDHNRSFTFEVDSFKFEYELLTRKLVVKDTIEKEPKKYPWMSYSPDSTWFVFSRNHNLYIMKVDDPDSVEIQLSTDGERWYSYNRDGDDTTSTKRLRANARWFKDSRKIYVPRYDSRKVKDLFVINALSNPRPELETYKYAMPGDKEVPQRELIIFDIETKEKVNIDVKRWKDQIISTYLTKDGSDKIYFIRKDRTCTKLEVCVANTETGEYEVLIYEESKPYFNGDYDQLAILNEGEDLIWWSERNGWGQLYLYDGKGNLKNQITDGMYVTGRIGQIDTLNRMVYFEGFGREKGIDPYNTMYYKASIDRGGMKLITPEDVNHSFNMSESSKYFVDNYSRVDMPTKSVVRDVNGTILLELESPDLTRLYEAGWVIPEKFTVKAEDGVTDLYGVMWKPFDFDPEKKYPIISYVYPGPFTESVPQSFTLGGRNNVTLAQVGFIVVSMGHRGGSPKRHKYYHTYGYDNLRDYALADDKYAIEQLADRFSFIDIEKVGIFGHSGGGFMSTAAMFMYPDFYKVAVSSAGNHDNNIYNLWWGETHHGVKEVVKKSKKKKENEEDTEKEEVKKEMVFESNIPNNQSVAKNLKGHLLLVHGDIDNNVHPGNSIRVVDALIKANKRFDFMIMPGQRHGFGKYSDYFEHMKWYYFAEHLLGDYRNNVEILEYDE